MLLTRLHVRMYRDLRRCVVVVSYPIPPRNPPHWGVKAMVVGSGCIKPQRETATAPRTPGPART
jgi:hypothetical protein